MNRLCIYVTYNRENKIYEYIGNALKSLKECCSDIYMVCNYENIADGLEYASPYIDGIFFRQNNGYDSGAYKEALFDFLGWAEVSKYDEIVLVNDSFFGFFYPLQDTFTLMSKEICDFWGMTGQEAGEYINPLYEFDAHVHSYFMVFKKKVVQSEAFRVFWETLKYPINFREAVVNYEIGINTWLKQHGFIGKSFIDVYNIKLMRNENPYYSMTYELIKDCKLPIMKKKCILIRNANFTGTLRTLDYLKKEDIYPISWIMLYLENQFYIPGIGDKPCNSLEIFYKNHSNIYIYGAGVCGKNLTVYFKHKGWQHKGLIVTDKTAQDTECLLFDDIQIDDETGIIISVIHQQVSEEIVKYIETKSNCRREQLFVVYDCKAIRLPE